MHIKYTVRQVMFIILFELLLRQITINKIHSYYAFSLTGLDWRCIHIRVSSPLARCAEAVRPHGVHLMELLHSDDETDFQKTTNAFVLIATIQVGAVTTVSSV